MTSVLVVVGLYPPDYSGAGLRASRFARMLTRNEVARVRVLTSGTGPACHDGGIDVHRIRLTDRAPFEAALPLRVASLVRFAGELYAGVFGYLLAHRHEYDVVHCFGGSRLSLAALAAAAVLGKPTMLELTLEGHDDAASIVARSALGRAGRELKRGLVRRVDRLVCNSRALAESCRAFGIDESRLWYRLNPVDATLFSPGPATAAERRSLGLPVASHIAVMVGVISRRKNQGFLIEALACTPPGITLVIAGPVEELDDEAYLVHLRHRVRALGLSERVIIFAEHRNDIPRLLRSADVFVFASRAEGCPNAVQEALCAGLPVLAVNACGVLDDLVLEGDGVVLGPQASPGDLAETMSTYREEPEARERRARRATARFAWSRVANRYAQIYRELTVA